MKFMYAAYIVTWIIHIAYIGYLMRGYLRVRQEAKELSQE